MENALCSGFLDIPAPKWDQMVVTQMNEEWFGHAAIKIEQQQILSVGGLGGNYLKTILKTTEIYNSQTERWLKGPDRNEKWAGPATALCNGKVYVVGGSNGRTFLDTIEYLDLSTKNHNWEMMPVELSCCQEGCTAVAIGTNVYIAGCFDGKMCVSSINILDTVTGTIQKGPSITTKWSGCVAGVVKNTIYVMGGRDGNGNTLDTIEYLTARNDGNPTATTWKMCTATISTTRWYPAVAVIKDCLVIMGGGFSNRTLKSVEVFDTKRNVFWNLPDMNKQQLDFAALTLEESKVIGIGGIKYDFDDFKSAALVEVLEWFETIENMDKCMDKHIEQATEQCWLEKEVWIHNLELAVAALKEQLDAA